ncbi:TPA: cation-translocating P-type ATPase [Candidatus Woesearchaeota archaeon]|nr:cation-translocating P-type ATPase [Candidatus Woesearchaeota archaeon]
MPDAYYAMKAEEVIRQFRSSEEGLRQEDAKQRLIQYGPNELEKGKKATWVQIFISQFKNPLMLLLMFAGVLSFFAGESIEGIAILCILFLNAILGFVQEYRAEQAMEALERVSAPIAKVLRNGEEMKIPAREVVPGDIVLLEAGDIVPADSRIFETSSLQIDESSLTGESVPSDKDAAAYKLGTSVADQENMAFAGTIVTYGRGKAIVVGTGHATELGKIATSIRDTKDEATPLQRKFEMLAKQIGIIVIVLVALVLGVGLYEGIAIPTMLFFALALTVSTIPNSLPVVVTVGLSMGARRLARKNLLVKKLAAAESLGAATFICTDKTGTLTKNEMTVTDIYMDGDSIKVSGTGYEPSGEFTLNGKPYDPEDAGLLLRIGYLCNSAKLVKNEKTGQHEVIGDPTEGSLVVLGRKAGLSDELLTQQHSPVQELPFDSDRKRMTVILKNRKTKKTEAFVKGAPDLLLTRCDRILENGRVRKLTPKDRDRLLKTNVAYAQSALRVLGFAYRDVSTLRSYTLETVEKGLIFVGLVGMIDPPRDEVPDAIAKCHSAGIKVMMITGDQPITAKAIAVRIGLWSPGSLVISGDELERMSDKELETKIEDIRIVARALPIQKVRIVDALKKHGHIVAMTGDGVNDAPALKRADIGIAMGSGSDVAREVAKGTLVDDNFSSIVNAIEEGRNVYDKILKSARYLLSCNAGEITSVFIALIMAFPLPILPLQLLLMNILTDDVPALGLGAETPDDGIMSRPPRDPKEKPLNGKMLFSIVFFGLIMGLGTVFVFLKHKDLDLPRAQTMAFTTLVMIQMFAVISARSLYPSWKKLNPLSNPYLSIAVCISVTVQLAVIYLAPLNAVFGTVPLAWSDWVLILEIAVYGFVGMEASKWFLHFVSQRKERKVVPIAPIAA